MATARLRKAFRYPGDDDGEFANAPPEGIDEEEQERLIKDIAAQDADSIAFYRAFFIALPLLALLYFTLILSVVPYPNGADFSSHPFFYVLAFVSLTLSFYVAYNIETPPRAGADVPVYFVRAEAAMSELTRGLPEPARNVLHIARTHIEFINGGVCGIAALVALLSRTAFTPGVSISFSALPVIAVFFIVVIARRELRPVSVKELEAMRYTYKGA